MAYPSLTITFLGTGTSSGVPMIACGCEVCTSDDIQDSRLRSSIMVQSSATTIIIDATPDFRFQMLREKVKKIDGLLITHPHKDHIAGIDDTRAFQFFNKKATDVFANKMSLEGVKKEIPYAFQQLAYPGVPKVNLHEITLDPFVIGDIPITPILVWHHKMPVYGFRFGKFTYITDANAIDEHEQNKIRGSEIVVLNALRKEPHISHFSLREAISLVENLEIPTAYFTHISHQLGLSTVINKSLPTGMMLAFDRMQLFV